MDSDALQVILCVKFLIVPSLRLSNLGSTMGIFPILMNILQFWLIDSIVKASASSDFFASDLPSNSSHEGDREPLFTNSSDDESDDPPHDIENPPPRSHSRSVSPTSHKPNQVVSVPTEQKSSRPSTPGSTSESRQHSIPMHAYPPSLSSSVPSLSNSSRPTSPESLVNRPRKYKRSTSVPISVTSPNQLAVDSPLQIPLILEPPRTDSSVKKPVQQEWAESWDDSDDWATQGVVEDKNEKANETRVSLNDEWGSNTGAIRTKSYTWSCSSG
jgi:hypothetical protein